MSNNYTTDYNGNPAYAHPYASRYETLPVIMGQGTVRAIAKEICDSVTSDARQSLSPVVFVTGNSFMPPLRSFPGAERVWDAANNADGELFAFLSELVEDSLNAEDILLACPEYDNSLYAVDMRRWQYRDDAAGDDLNDEWEQV